MNLIEFEQSIAELLERLNNMMSGTTPTLINIVLVIIGVVKLLEVAKKYIKEHLIIYAETVMEHFFRITRMKII